MATTAIGTVLHNLRRSLLRQDEADLTDGDLLESFITRRDTVAFEALMRRHGPMVLGVCRRVLRNEADAEDAFQATFLVLVRKAASIRPRGMVGNWLYGVAHSTALKARAMSTKRLAKEREAAERPTSARAADSWQHLQALLDQELKALPDKYRAAIVLCDLEGKSIKEAARQLGCPQGTVGTRLARGRRLLARRLARQGLALSGGVIATVIAQQAAAGVPPVLMSSTVKAATLIAAGQAAATGVISAKVATLTEGVLKAMFLTKLKIATGVFLMLAVIGMGAWGIGSRPATAEQPIARGSDQGTTRDDKRDGQKQPEKARKERKVLTPEEAIKQRPKEKIAVEFKVSYATIHQNPAFVPEGGEIDCIDFKYDDRFYARLYGKPVTHLKRLGLAPPRMGFNISYFTNKVVRVTGLVVAEEELATEKTKYYVVVEDLDQLEVVR
jgi:RNA polymerase sigma factor (sigma-70 family)